MSQQMKQNQSSMIGNDGELSMETLDSVCGGVYGSDGYVGRVNPSGNVYGSGGYIGRVNPSGNLYGSGGYVGRVLPSGSALS